MARRGNNEVAENPERLNRIVSGAEIEGHLELDSSLRLDGRLNGSINCKGRLVLGASGVIEGNVSCANADVEGAITGDLKVAGTLFLRSTAKIQGNIHTQKIVVENGAEFNGNCIMTKDVDTTVVKPNPTKEVEEEPQMVY